mmetsp:Transcript_83631/g.245215  ORF Transcript_83631/g.245215 Transcript_83631/m.245215 type:complete len:205 (+) Transcript_83631:161-775(+)
MVRTASHNARQEQTSNMMPTMAAYRPRTRSSWGRLCLQVAKTNTYPTTRGINIPFKSCTKMFSRMMPIHSALTTIALSTTVLMKNIRNAGELVAAPAEMAPPQLSVRFQATPSEITSVASSEDPRRPQARSSLVLARPSNGSSGTRNTFPITRFCRSRPLACTANVTRTADMTSCVTTEPIKVSIRAIAKSPMPNRFSTTALAW